MKMLMNLMIKKCKQNGIFIDRPNENNVDRMYQSAADFISSLSNNPRLEMFSWQTHIHNVSRELKWTKNKCTSNQKIFFKYFISYKLLFITITTSSFLASL